MAPLYFGAHSYLIILPVKGWAPALLGYHRYPSSGWRTEVSGCRRSAGPA